MKAPFIPSPLVHTSGGVSFGGMSFGGVRMLVAVLAGLSTFGLMTAEVSAAEVIGKAETIENRVTGEVEAQSRTLGVPDSIHRDEMVRTAEKAQARLRFTDETDLRLGPQAAIKLDAFVFSGKKEAAMELMQGTMRFVSGNGPKGSYQIKTPVATIGLRGTTVEVTIRNGRTYVSLHEGEAQVCTRTGRCMDLTNACTYLYVDNRGVTLPQPLSNRVPTYSGQCTGDFCVVDRCSPQLSGAPSATPPATTPRATPPRATPPKAQPPKQKPPRPRRRGNVQEEEIIIDEPEYLPPRGGFIRPDFPIGPRFPGGRPPRWPDGRPQPDGRPPGTRPPKGGEGYPFPGRPGRPGILRPGNSRPQIEAPVRRGGGNDFFRGGRGGGFNIR